MNDAASMPQRKSYTGLTVVHGKVACTIPPDDETVHRRRLGRQCGIKIRRKEIKQQCLMEHEEEVTIQMSTKKKKDKLLEMKRLLTKRNRDEDKLAPPSFVVGGGSGISLGEHELGTAKG